MTSQKIDRVSSLSQAKEWFLENSSGDLECVVIHGGYSEICKCYPDAVSWYGSMWPGKLERKKT